MEICSRFSQPLQFQVNDKLIAYVNIGNVRLYFDQDSQTQTIQDLNHQFKLFTDRDLTQVIKDVKIDQQVLLKDIIPTFETKDVFQDIINNQKIENESQNFISQDIIAKIQMKGKKISFQQGALLNIQANYLHQSQFKTKTVQFDCKPHHTFLDIAEEVTKSLKIEDAIKKYRFTFIDSLGKRYKKKLKRKAMEVVQIAALENKNLSMLIENKKKIVQLYIANRFAKKYFFQYQIDIQETTLNSLIRLGQKSVQQKNILATETVQISNGKGQIYEQQDYQIPISELCQQDQTLSFNIIFLTKQCLFRAQTQFLIAEKGQFEYMKIDKIVQNKIKKIYSYDFKNHVIVEQKLNYQNIRTIDYVYKYLALSLRNKKESICLQCSEEMFVLDQNKKWVATGQLQKGDNILVLSKQFTEFDIFTVDCVDRRISEVGLAFVSVSLQKYHNFVANRVICHNAKKFKFNIEAINEQNESKTISFYETDIIGQKFKNCICSIAGKVLSSQLSFGDLQLKNFKSIFISNKQPQRLQKGLHKFNNKKIFMSQFKQPTVQYLSQDNLRKQRWSDHFLGIHNGQILQLNVGLSKLQQLQICLNGKNNEAIQIVVAQKMKLLRQQMYLNKINKYTQPLETMYSSFSNLPELDLDRINQGNLKTKQDLRPIFYYTSEAFYSEFNKFLREWDDSIYPDDIKQKWYTYTKDLVDRLQLLDPFRGIVYRGVKNLIPDNIGIVSDATDSYKYLIFKNFTSTSQSEEKARGFTNQNGILFKIHCETGRSIQKYSVYPEEKQVLVSSSSYFQIINIDKNISPIVVELQQIPQPKTDSQRIIFWVDDEPNNNLSLTYKFKQKNIEVIQIRKTSVMELILKEFFWIYRILGKQVLIISDMSRKQDGKWNNFAGVELFEIIYKQYSLTNPAIIFCGNKEGAQSKIKQKNLESKSWIVTTSQIQLEQIVRKYFNI